jgi:peptidoglycan/xylan/chitin deacetylase (PgdA/CDA1 family)
MNRLFAIDILILLLVVALAIYYSRRYAWWKKAVDYQQPRILMYHMIREPISGAKFNSLRVSPAMFEKQIRHLHDNDWHFFTLSELITSKHKLPEKSIAITFDDGYEDNLTNALPILKKYQAKATIYLVVDRHNREWSSKRKKKNKSDELMQEPKLQDGQVRELIESGLIEIGSHTLTHDNLPILPFDKKQREIVESRQQLQSQFNIDCESFCYPFGLYDETDLQLVKQAGYSSATTVEKGTNDLVSADPYQLKRITISGKDNFLAFKLKLKTGKRGVKK